MQTLDGQWGEDDGSYQGRNHSYLRLLSSHSTHLLWIQLNWIIPQLGLCHSFEVLGPNGKVGVPLDPVECVHVGTVSGEPASVIFLETYLLVHIQTWRVNSQSEHVI